MAIGFGHQYLSWSRFDEKTILRELKPAAVREKLGEPRFSPVYSFLSEIGTHGTFRGVQGRVAKRVRTDTGDDQRASIAVWVGGIPREDQIVFAISFCIIAVVSALFLAAAVFQDRLNEEEVMQILQASVDQGTAFLKEHFVVWAGKNGFDVAELLQSIEKTFICEMTLQASDQSQAKAP